MRIYYIPITIHCIYTGTLHRKVQLSTDISVEYELSLYTSVIPGTYYAIDALLHIILGWYGRPSDQWRLLYLAVLKLWKDDWVIVPVNAITIGAYLNFLLMCSHSGKQSRIKIWEQAAARLVFPYAVALIHTRGWVNCMKCWNRILHIKVCVLLVNVHYISTLYEICQKGNISKNISELYEVCLYVLCSCNRYSYFRPIYFKVDI